MTPTTETALEWLHKMCHIRALEEKAEQLYVQAKIHIPEHTSLLLL